MCTTQMDSPDAPMRQAALDVLQVEAVRDGYQLKMRCGMSTESSQAPRDHDQRSKVVLKEFFAEFIEFALPEIAAQLDFSRLRWADKEAFSHPPEGLRSEMDLLAEVPMRTPDGDASDASALTHVLILTEIEARSTIAFLIKQIKKYYYFLDQQGDREILPIALLLHVGLDGIGWKTITRSFAGREISRLSFAYVGLPALDAEEHVRGSNPLGIAFSALMKARAERLAWIKATALKRITKSKENEYRQFLLGGVVDTYLKLNEEQQEEFRAMLKEPEYKEAAHLTTSWHEEGRKEGREEGREEGKREMLLKMGTKRFGAPSAELRAALEEVHDLAQLEALGERLLEVSSWDDLLSDKSH